MISVCLIVNVRMFVYLNTSKAFKSPGKFLIYFENHTLTLRWKLPPPHFPTIYKGRVFMGLKVNIGFCAC